MAPNTPDSIATGEGDIFLNPQRIFYNKEPIKFDVPATSPSLEMFWSCMDNIAGASIRFPYGLIIGGIPYKGPITLSRADILERKVKALQMQAE